MQRPTIFIIIKFENSGTCRFWIFNPMSEAFLTIFSEINRRTALHVSNHSDCDMAEDFSINVEVLPGFESKIVGKVRDIYICSEILVLVTSNRQSAFDRLLCSVPSKGKVCSSFRSDFIFSSSNFHKGFESYLTMVVSEDKRYCSKSCYCLPSS